MDSAFSHVVEADTAIRSPFLGIENVLSAISTSSMPARSRNVPTTSARRSGSDVGMFREVVRTTGYSVTDFSAVFGAGPCALETPEIRIAKTPKTAGRKRTCIVRTPGRDCHETTTPSRFTEVRENHPRDGQRYVRKTEKRGSITPHPLGVSLYRYTIFRQHQMADRRWSVHFENGRFFRVARPTCWP